MPPTVEAFRPMTASQGTKGVRIEHVCTSGSNMEPLPFLVDAQRKADRRTGRGTWVVLGTSTEEAFFAVQLKGMNALGEYKDDDDKGRWHVRCTMDMDEVVPGDDYVVITTVEELNNLLIFAKGEAPRQFGTGMTFMLVMGWGHLTLPTAMTYNRLVRLIFETKDTSDRWVCAVSSAAGGPFNEEWVGKRHAYVVRPRDETPKQIQWLGNEDASEAMDDLADGITKKTSGRAIMLMDHDAAQQLPKIGPAFEKRCCTFTPSNMPSDEGNKSEDCWKHAVISGRDLTFLGYLPNLTHTLIYPLRDGWVWDEEISQVVLQRQLVLRSKPEIWSAMCWRGPGEASQVHILGLEEDFGYLPDEPTDLMAHTVHFDHLVLSCLSTWGGFTVAQWPLKIGSNIYLVEERLRRLLHKGLVEDTAVGTTDPHGQFMSRNVLQLTERGDIARALTDPHTIHVDSIHSACLLAQITERSSTATPALTDAVCSLAVVLNGFDGGTYINGVIEPTDRFGEFNPCPKTVTFEHCYRGPIFLAVSAWHTLRGGGPLMQLAQNPHLQAEKPVDSYQDYGTMKLWFMVAVEWENTMLRLQEPLKSVGVDVGYGKTEHSLTSEEFLEVEEAMVTAFLDKLAFVRMPAGDGPFGYLVATGTELGRPLAQQMRLIDMDKCWTAEIEAGGQNTDGIFCVFTYHLTSIEGEELVCRPYDLTCVSTVAVARALRKVNAPMDLDSLLSKVRTWYKVCS